MAIQPAELEQLPPVGSRRKQMSFQNLAFFVSHSSIFDFLL